MDRSCVFCRIIANEQPSYVLYDNDTTRAFLDIYGVTDGHTLVTLKRHGDTILDYTADELKDLWSTVQKIVIALQKSFETKTISIGINHGEVAGVHHLHVHVMPRYPHDGGRIVQELAAKKRVQDFGLVQKKIRGELSNEKGGA